MADDKRSGREEPRPHPHALFKPFAKNAERAFTPLHRAVDPKTAIVVLDTNVLLAPYKTSTAALSEIKRIYSRLSDEGRLVVPGQVAREFARNRPTMVADVYKRVRDAKSLSINGRYDAPLVLHDLPEHKKAVAELDKAREAMKVFKESLDALATIVSKWHQADPVLDVYGWLFGGSTVIELDIDPAEVERIAKARYSVKMPPGYMDRSKDDGGVGDLVIWMTLLQVAKERKRDAIFVSEDTKEDWFHRAGDEALFSRYELGLEFEEATSGRAFGQMTLSGLLSAFGAKEEVIEEVREKEGTPSMAMGARETESAVWDAIKRAMSAKDNLCFPPDSRLDAILEPHDEAPVSLSVKRVTSGVSIGWLLTSIRAGLVESRRRGLSEHVVLLVVDVSTAPPDSKVSSFISDVLVTREPGLSGILLHMFHDGELLPALNLSRNSLLRRAFPSSGDAP